MTIGLEGVSTLYLDANILVYFIEGAPDLRARFRLVFAQAGECGIALATSEMTIAECLRGAFRRRDRALVDVYRSLLGRDDLLHLVAVDVEVLTAAAKLAASCEIKLIDAIHVASATRANCQALLTNDQRLRAPEEVRVLRLDHLAASPSAEKRAQRRRRAGIRGLWRNLRQVSACAPDA